MPNCSLNVRRSPGQSRRIVQEKTSLRVQLRVDVDAEYCFVPSPTWRFTGKQINYIALPLLSSAVSPPTRPFPHAAAIDRPQPSLPQRPPRRLLLLRKPRPPPHRGSLRALRARHVRSDRRHLRPRHRRSCTRRRRRERRRRSPHQSSLPPCRRAAGRAGRRRGRGLRGSALASAATATATATAERERGRGAEVKGFGTPRMCTILAPVCVSSCCPYSGHFNPCQLWAIAYEHHRRRSVSCTQLCRDDFLGMLSVGSRRHGGEVLLTLGERRTRRLADKARHFPGPMLE
jgi:hypothetical protein